MKSLLSIILLTLSGCIVVPQTVDKNSNLPVIELDGYPFHAELFGEPDNPVVIVLHGGPGADSSYLRNISTAWSEQFQVL